MPDGTTGSVRPDDAAEGDRGGAGGVPADEHDRPDRDRPDRDGPDRDGPENGGPQKDPQKDEDEEVKRRRGDDGRAAVIDRWLQYAVSERCHAARLRAEHQQPFDQLRDARAETRVAAARLLRATPDINEATAQMMAEVTRLSVRVPPLLGFDEAMVSYTRARTWQACARELCPDLAEIQPRWPDTRTS